MLEENILDIEQKALELLLAKRKEAKLTETQLGELAFPAEKNPRGKIHSLWNIKNTQNKPLRLRLGDYCAMCHALGLDPAKELFQLWNGANHE